MCLEHRRDGGHPVKQEKGVLEIKQTERLGFEGEKQKESVLSQMVPG